MEKTIRWNVTPEEQEAETYSYWQNVSVAKRLIGVWELSRDAYSLKGYNDDGPDFRDILLALNAHNAKYLVVGGYAIGVHSEPRATKDLDLWVLTDIANSKGRLQGARRLGSAFDWGFS